MDVQMEDLGRQPGEQLIIHLNNFWTNFDWDNRWKYNNHVVDYAAIEERWDDRRLQADYSNLKRLKIFNLPWKPMTGLLNRLNGSTVLRELEIDTLKLLGGSRTEYTFDALELLSIDSVRVVDQSGQPPLPQAMSPPNPTVKFNGTKMIALYFGSDSLRYVTISDYGKVTHLEVEEDPEKKLLKFRHLKTLVCNNVQAIDLSVLTKFVSGEMGELKRLHCNRQKLTYSSFILFDEEVVQLKAIYRHLRKHLTKGAVRSIYFHGVHVDLKRPFASHRFGSTLVHCHYHNFERKIRLARLPSLTEIDFRDLLELPLTDGVATEFIAGLDDQQDEALVVELARIYP